MTYDPLNDWLDALSILRPTFPNNRPIEALVKNASIIYSPIRHHQVATFEIIPGSALIPRQVKISLRVTSASKIERVELCLWAACVASEILTGASLSEAITTYGRMFRAGCAASSTADISERWRVIDINSHYSQLPIIIFEDRAKCSICPIPIATGSEAAGYPGTHHLCRIYAHRVLAPALLKARSLGLVPSHAELNAEDAST